MLRERFQTQPGELDLWPDDLLLHADSALVFDPDWPDEALVDTSTAATRDGIAEIVIPWIKGCADAGIAAGQQNAAEGAEVLYAQAGFDFALVEECAAYDECAELAAVYGDHVIATC